MTPFARLAVLAVVACVQAQYAEERAPRYIASEPKEQASTPVPILKQINRRWKSKFKPEQKEQTATTVKLFPAIDKKIKKKSRDSLVVVTVDWQASGLGYEPKARTSDFSHNEDGSYTYGYEAADGSFKIETKSATGEVKGKYGYKDDTGKVRVIEYGANKYGFQPAGEGITVAPPTLVDETTRDRPLKGQGNRNQQYRPAPAQAVDYDYNDEPAAAPSPRPAPRPSQQYRAQPAPQPQFRAPAPQPQPQFRAPQPTQQPQYRPAPQPQQQYRPTQGPTPPKPQFFSGAAQVPAQDNNNFFNPEPPQRQYKPKQDFRPNPQFQQFSDANEFSVPAPRRQPQYQPQNDFGSQERPLPPSMLDELLKEYSLPLNGAAPLHDIAFGAF